MAEPTVKFPVVCPECRREVLTTLTVAFATEALIRGKNIRLHSNCHDKWWDASSVEIEQLREYVGALGLGAQSEITSRAAKAPHIHLVVDNAGSRPTHDAQEARPIET
jgi:hypothetical protein